MCDSYSIRRRYELDRTVHIVLSGVSGRDKKNKQLKPTQSTRTIEH